MIEKKNSVSNIVGKVSLVLVLVFSLFYCSKSIYASSSNFNVSPEIPENQVDKNLGYFNLVMSPESQQTLSFKVNNATSKSITVEMAFAHSTTNGNGLAIYDSSKAIKDSSLKYNIEDFVDIPKKEVTIAAHAQVIMTAKVTMPKGMDTGILSGGFSFKEKEGNQESGSSKGVSIKNEYRYVIALVTQQNIQKVSPQLKLNEVKATQVNSRNVFAANLQNISPTYLQDMNATATVKGVTNSELKYSFENSDMKMAPNSNFDFAIPVSIKGNIGDQTSKALEAGKYHLSMTVYGVKSATGAYETTVNGKTVNYEYKWTFEKDFEIAGEKAKKLNNSDPTVHYKEPINWLMIIGIALILIILLLTFLIFSSRRKKENHQK
ncbi:DUF916 and DUF3324 domain-containing protein [Lactococcus lactis]|jgi:hypothetical protein|uniref:Cell surface protein n=1 Tax=Lactococcus lactis TaxID=1358 RepID=A0AAW5TQK8_9LACT|nr:DUF916 and DUF3324 domain-containing protein [Lactococcus lactis]MCC4120850.1 DUF916 and DUF3324 domain-containing protein [Lactococcus lactis]MCJ7967669.1 DUF916 and DUF3324 domain-containing protein [Lactococcus lactis]MCT3091439.1 DUF916 and DUF3324 domain-containing protein [Lactococcus lactis]MCW2281053.1 hypothetical protein [Lactococcus lactis]MDT2967005.1 DUF916 and DUF3324 domain-containing protein [Lactococcus lactis]